MADSFKCPVCEKQIPGTGPHVVRQHMKAAHPVEHEARRVAAAERRAARNGGASATDEPEEEQSVDPEIGLLNDAFGVFDEYVGTLDEAAFSRVARYLSQKYGAAA